MDSCIRELLPSSSPALRHQLLFLNRDFEIADLPEPRPMRYRVITQVARLNYRPQLLRILHGYQLIVEYLVPI
jgi:hypothetical protein